VVAWVMGIFCKFYFAKKCKVANSSTTTNAQEKMSADLSCLEFWINLHGCLTKFQNNQILI
jgi:hypothetical protein